jgi:hypothetical protein
VPGQIERATARVLTSESTLEVPDVRAVRDTDMQRKVVSRHIITTDQGGNKVGGRQPAASTGCCGAVRSPYPPFPTNHQRLPCHLRLQVSVGDYATIAWRYRQHLTPGALATCAQHTHTHTHTHILTRI